MYNFATYFADGTGRRMTATTTSARVAIPNLGATRAIELQTGNQDVHVRFGDSSVVALAYTGDPLAGDGVIKGSSSALLHVPRDATHIALITDNGDSVCDIVAVIAYDPSGV